MLLRKTKINIAKSHCSFQKAVEKVRTINTGIDGVLKFIKEDVTRFSLGYIIFVDKEHCSSDCENDVNKLANKYGISISATEKIAEDLDIYKLTCSIGK